MGDVTVLFATHAKYAEHLAGGAHPERPSRLTAVCAGARESALHGALRAVEPRVATREELELVHPSWYLDRLDILAERGGDCLRALPFRRRLGKPRPQVRQATHFAQTASVGAARDLEQAGAISPCQVQLARKREQSGDAVAAAVAV